jgi:basic membrane lipoprotein Med (substrate-binding protein (PBP1-ABC) superfamily)
MEKTKFIEKWKINQTLLADRLGLSKGSVSLKLRELNGQRFTEHQDAILDEIILEIIEDAKSTIKVK